MADDLDKFRPLDMSLIESIIQDGYELKIEPARLTNSWLGVDVIGYKATVLYSGRLICSSTHRLLDEAISDVYFDMPTGEMTE